MSVDHGAVRGMTTRPAAAVTTLDLLKHVLRCEEANAVRWLKDQRLIGRPPQHDQKTACDQLTERLKLTMR